VALIYVIGLLTRWWAFRWVLRLLERALSRLPVVKSIYQGVRDVLALFAGDAERMGRVVRYRLPGTEIQLLGIQTTTSPRATDEPGKVALYIPMSYMFGGPTVYVDGGSVQPVDMTVAEALRVAVTAGAAPSPPGPGAAGKPPPAG
jgi:uncharacterized membrane protein